MGLGRLVGSRSDNSDFPGRFLGVFKCPTELEYRGSDFRVATCIVGNGKGFRNCLVYQSVLGMLVRRAAA